MSFATAFVFLALAAAQPAKLEIRNVQASLGQLGPERKSAEYVSGDEVYFRFTVAGVRTDADGRTNAEMRITVADAKGKTPINNTFPFQQVIALGGGTIPGSASFFLDGDFPPGEYEVSVEFTDRLAKESVSFKRKITCKATEFALVRVRFHQDRGGNFPAPVGGTVGQTLFFGFGVVGFDRSKGEIDVEMEIAVLDAKGKPVIPKPFRVVEHNEKPAEVKKKDYLPFFGSLTLNRPGEFVLRITVTDTPTKKKVTFEAPLRVNPL